MSVGDDDAGGEKIDFVWFFTVVVQRALVFLGFESHSTMHHYEGYQTHAFHVEKRWRLCGLGASSIVPMVRDVATADERIPPSLYSFLFTLHYLPKRSEEDSRFSCLKFRSFGMGRGDGMTLTFPVHS